MTSEIPFFVCFMNTLCLYAVSSIMPHWTSALVQHVMLSWRCSVCWKSHIVLVDV